MWKMCVWPWNGITWTNGINIHLMQWTWIYVTFVIIAALSTPGTVQATKKNGNKYVNGNPVDKVRPKGNLIYIFDISFSMVWSVVGKQRKKRHQCNRKIYQK